MDTITTNPTFAGRAIEEEGLSTLSRSKQGGVTNAIVIIPTYNERVNLASLIPAILEVDDALDILVVDDGSPDGTGELVETFTEQTTRVQMLQRGSKQGLGTAYLDGFRYALSRGYDHMVQMDADFSHRPEDLPRLLMAAEDADLVIGSRNVPGGRVENWSLMRKFISKGGSLYARTLLSLPIKDCTGGFKCFHRRVLEVLDLESVRSNGYGFQVEMNYLCQRAGFKIIEVPIVFPDRTIGQSKMSARIFAEAARLVWQLRGQEPSISPELASDSGRRFPRSVITFSR
jgi:dolichol-phosphate mannosyltransferase